MLLHSSPDSNFSEKNKHEMATELALETKPQRPLKQSAFLPLPRAWGFELNPLGAEDTPASECGMSPAPIPLFSAGARSGSGAGSVNRPGSHGVSGTSLCE